MPKINNDWLEVIGDEFEKPYYKKLRAFLAKEYKENTVYPVADDLFSAFHHTPYSKVKVLILGQDPYHNVNQAHGLCFSVKPQQEKLPPSLINIFKELHSDLGISPPENGYLLPWAQQGVLLLNTVLSVKEHQANSHQGKGWEVFTDNVIKAVNEIDRPVVYLLWGKPAQSKEYMLTNKKHLVLKAPHPSPLSAHRGFFGCKHFSKCNEFLINNGEQPINWNLKGQD